MGRGVTDWATSMSDGTCATSSRCEEDKNACRRRPQASHGQSVAAALAYRVPDDQPCAHRLRRSGWLHIDPRMLREQQLLLVTLEVGSDEE